MRGELPQQLQTLGRDFIKTPDYSVSNYGPLRSSTYEAYISSAWSENFNSCPGHCEYYLNASYVKLASFR